MAKVWPLQDAKARLSELVRAASKEPQVITLRGEEAAVVVSVAEYQRWRGKPKRTLSQILRSCPYQLDIPSRSMESAREVDL